MGLRMQLERTSLIALALVALPFSALAQPPVAPVTPSESVERAVELSKTRAQERRLAQPEAAFSAAEQTPKPVEEARPRRAESPAPPGGYGLILLKLALAVALVCAAAFVSLKYGLRRLVGGPTQDAPMRVLSRLPLEPRRSLIVTQVASRTLVLATSEAGIQLIAELDDADALALTGVIAQADGVSRETPQRPFDLDTDGDPDAEAPVQLE